MQFVGTANEESRNECETHWFNEEEICAKGNSLFKIRGGGVIFFVKEECGEVAKDKCAEVAKQECGKAQERGRGDSSSSVERDFVSEIKFKGEGTIFFVKEGSGGAHAGG